MIEKLRAEELTNEEIAVAEKRGLESEVSEARATSACYDRDSEQLLLSLRGGMVLLIPARLLQGVGEATPEIIERVRVVSGGMALRWEELDADFLVQSLVAGSFGTRRWMERLRDEGALDPASARRLNDVAKLNTLRASASEMGRRGGRATSEVKVMAARLNGAKGGRPRNQPQQGKERKVPA